MSQKNKIQGLTTKDKILQAAMQLFFEHGYKDVSYEMLIKETGFSKGAIYHHFKSKDDLLVSVFDFFHEGFHENAKMSLEVKIKDYRALKDLIVQTKISQIEAFRKMIGKKSLKVNKLLFFVEALSENKKLVDTMAKIMKEEKSLLQRCFFVMEKKEGLITEKNSSIWAEIMYIMLEGAEMQMFLSENEVTANDFGKAYKRAFDDFEKLFRN